MVVKRLDEKIRFKKRFERRTDTNVGEDWTQRKIREDRSFAPKKNIRGCPLTKIVPRQIPSTFFGAPEIVLEKR